MMNRFIHSFLLLGCVAWALAGCTADPEVEGSLPIDGDGSASWITIDFSDESFDQINIKTRATLDNVAESRVLNIFVFLFGPEVTDEKGNVDAPRIYGRFFDHTNRVDTPYELEDATKEECWWVADNVTEDMPHGRVHILAPAISGGTLYILANVNADMVNISPDKLRFVEKLSDLKNMTATLNQEITERNGFFPMTGLAGDAEGNIAIGSNKITCGGSADFEVPLRRLDAKIEVKIRVAKGYRGSKKDDASVTTTHEIESFVPLSWQVVNMPRTAFVVSHTEDAATHTFATKETKFETREPDSLSYTYYDEKTKKYVTKENVKTEAHGFSFYMLENRAAAKAPVPIEAPDPSDNNDKGRLYEAWGYHARETRLKDDNGAYTAEPDETNDIWKYAPAEGTYLVIKGEVVMALDISNEGKNQQLSADAIYYIHLGNFGGTDKDGDGRIEEDANGNGIIEEGESEYGDLNNYDVLRNTSYTYTVTIFGVDNIQVEVEKKKQENQSGATGHVYVAKESILTFDSHFGSAVVSFDEGHITDVEHLLWYVRTPFGREGKPHVIGGIEVPAGLDYQWVKFIVNKRNEKDEYFKNQAKYHPEDVMNILDFSKYIKEQKLLFTKDKEDGVIDNDSDFRGEPDEDWKKKFPDDPSVWTRYRIYVTVFVDEFYYDANPITGDVRQDLWKDFVNQPNRLMHILCDADESADEASRTTGSVLTIRQRSIQTIFNTEKAELKTAWGCETIDETRDSLFYFSRKEGYNTSGYPITVPGVPDNLAYAAGNDSNGNGLYNTARMWGLLTGWGDATEYNAKLWSDYVDYDRSNYLYDADDKETLRYACMTRNRDENGNGNIDAMEVKWYMAAISQLTSLYVGDQGLSTDALMYPYYKQQITSPAMDKWNTYPWRVHIVSSTSFGGWPEVLWAEEGLSTSRYCDTWGKSAHLSARCVRNLGMDPTSETDAVNKLADKDHNMPEKAIQVSGPGVEGNTETATPTSVYRFDLTNLNPQSIRYYSSQELEPRDEHSVEARTYWAFETGVLTNESYTYDALYDLIRDGKSPCPDGYRMPNVREGALMSMRCHGDWQPVISYVSTYYSHGLRGSNQDLGADITKPETRSNSWVFNGTKTYLAGKNEAAQVRCVRDIRQ